MEIKWTSVHGELFCVVRIMHFSQLLKKGPCFRTLKFMWEKTTRLQNQLKKCSFKDRKHNYVLLYLFQITTRSRVSTSLKLLRSCKQGSVNTYILQDDLQKDVYSDQPAFNKLLRSYTCLIWQLTPKTNVFKTSKRYLITHRKIL